ncbi:Ig-like domain-containing protein, partial [Archangium sp.]|uniref:Ig-like domain-containing protein n=1 Tax=Archangium sp. TaxID=1872627 RepID=UPI002ED8DE75
MTFIGCKPQQSSDQPGEGTGGNSFVELGSGSSPLKPAPKVRSITVSPSSTAVPVGRTVQFTAKGVHKDGTTVDLTDSVTWTSSDTSIATVSGTGLGTGVAVGGPVTLTATFEKMSGTARLIVTDAVLSSIAITPAVESVPAGMTQQFTASGIYSNGTTIDVTDSVTWTSSDTSIATVDGTGLGKGVRVGGHVTLTATLGNVSGTAQLTVTQAVLTAIALTPATASVPAGMTQQFTANGSYSDGTTVDITNNVTWTSSNTSIATVSDRGVGNGAAPGGPVTVTATLGGMSGTSQLDVTRAVLTAIAVTPATASVPAGMTQQFTANGSYSDGTTVDITNTVTWTSGDTSLATVDGTGLGIGVAAGGPVTLTATLDDVSGSSQLTVTQAVLTSIAITPAA